MTKAEALLLLPQTPFVLTKWSTTTTGPVIHIKVGRTFYSVHWKLIGRRVNVRSPPPWCRFSTKAAWSRRTPLSSRAKRTYANDYPPEKIAFHMRTPM